MIETERLILRTPDPDDGDALHEVYSDPEVMRDIGSLLGAQYERDVGRGDRRAQLSALERA